jgi:hypothetical protein
MDDAKNIQSVHFNKKYWTKSSSNKWLESKNIKPIKSAHVTENEIQYRVQDPAAWKEYYTVRLKNHINIIFFSN